MNSVASNDGDHTPTSSGVENTPPQQVGYNHLVEWPGSDWVRFDVPSAGCPDCAISLVLVDVAVSNTADAKWLMQCPSCGFSFEVRAL